MDAYLAQKLEQGVGMQVYAMEFNHGRIVTSHLGSHEDVRYALGQIACLLAAGIKLRIDRHGISRMSHSTRNFGEWVTSHNVVPSDVTVEQLYAEIGKADSDIVLGAVYALWCNYWPEGTNVLTGVSKVTKAMSRIGDMLFMPTSYPTVSISDTGYQSLKKRVKETMKEAQHMGIYIHNEPLFLKTLQLLGSGISLLAMHEFEAEVR